MRVSVSPLVQTGGQGRTTRVEPRVRQQDNTNKRGREGRGQAKRGKQGRWPRGQSENYSSMNINKTLAPTC